MLKIEKKPKEIIEIFGKKIEITKPTVSQLAEYTEKAKENVEAQVKAAIALLTQIGIPSEIINELDSESFVSVIEYLFNSKKK